MKKKKTFQFSIEFKIIDDPKHKGSEFEFQIYQLLNE